MLTSLYLGTNSNNNLEVELRDSYLDGMSEAEQMDYDVSFWQLFYNFNSTIGNDSQISKFRTGKTESN
jgi:hypothetical protein